MAEKYKGPYQIVRLKSVNNVESKIKNKRNLIVHVNRLKPYHSLSRFKVLEEETDIETNSDSERTDESDMQDRQLEKPTKLKSEKVTEKQKKDRQTEDIIRVLALLLLLQVENLDLIYQMYDPNYKHQATNLQANQKYQKRQ